VQAHTTHGQAADFHNTLSENEDGGSQALATDCDAAVGLELSMVSLEFRNSG
jgi:hypothetical protein